MGVKHSTFLMANCKNFPVNDFPDDILQTIFVNLDGNYLIHICRRVCKRWKAIADLQTLWKEKCSRNGIYKPNINIDVDYKILFFYNPYGKNFIRNWNASGICKFMYIYISVISSKRHSIDMHSSKVKIKHYS